MLCLYLLVAGLQKPRPIRDSHADMSIIQLSARNGIAAKLSQTAMSSRDGVGSYLSAALSVPRLKGTKGVLCGGGQASLISARGTRGSQSLHYTLNSGISLQPRPQTRGPCNSRASLDVPTLTCCCWGGGGEPGVAPQELGPELPGPLASRQSSINLSPAIQPSCHASQLTAEYQISTAACPNAQSYLPARHTS